MSYTWEKDKINYPENLVGEYDRQNSPDRFLFKRGEVLTLNKTPIITFNASMDEILKFDELENNSGISLVSEKFAEKLSSYAKNEVQFLNTVIKANDGEITTYKLVNVIKSMQQVC